MRDTDYNGLVLRTSQVFFPCIGACDNLQKRLEAEFDDSVWTHLAGMETEPFVWSEHRCIAAET
ncbi:MAG: hypothetical protein JJU22_18450 [Gammaproteobacteria bacterium]|nr:hypothetical protein [Gammaproteobacteria bacterium]